MDRDLLFRFFDGRATIEEKKKIKEWTEASEKNLRMFEKERSIFNVMILSGGADLKKNIISAKKEQSYFLRHFSKVAAVIALAMGTAIAFVLMNVIGLSDERMAMQTIIVPPGQRVQLELPDGTSVWLNAGTRMKYPLSFMRERREVVLDGEAYFEVVHNRKSPFIVRTAAMDVEVLGTKFNVEAYAEKGFFETSLMEGKVQVRLPYDKRQQVVLEPNYKTTLKEGKLWVSKIEDQDIYRWREGLYCFKHKSFEQIIEDLEKYYDLEIEIGREQIKDVKLSGKFRISEGLDYALRILQQHLTFDYYREQDAPVIHIK